jgi:hypothetical protein
MDKMEGGRKVRACCMHGCFNASGDGWRRRASEDSKIDQPDLNAYYRTVKRRCPSDPGCSIRSGRVDLTMGADSL